MSLSEDAQPCSTAENFLVRELALLRIPLEDIVTATNNFSQENLLKRGGNADVYKGLLLTHSKDWIQVVIRKFGHLCVTSEFYGEIEIIASLKHRNVVSLIGFCDEKKERMIVMEHALNGSLDKYLSDPTVLTWSQRLDICFGAALASKSIHFYIHGIRSFKILLNKDWEAKVLHCIESKSSWYDTKNSYVYSMGVILLEVLYGRKATIEDVIRYLAHKELDDHMIDPNLRKQMVPKSLSIILETAYDCLNEKPYQQRPYMYQIVKKLKEAFEIQWKHENLSLMEKFTYLKIPLMQIMIATNNFYGTYCINIRLSTRGKLGAFEDSA
ncbi:hypothetical protein QVD17_03301 [Tagetes erecta]|uniref:Protein kinase domain-containing protein n=1 Tax=Tagetes erecta TaxID=13708 RepID=A0AAD8L846_TARER|nr:hypothetical protein QVD17_03301 [Tagetes erecta]